MWNTSAGCAINEAGPGTALAMYCGQVGDWEDGWSLEAARYMGSLSGRGSSGGCLSIRNSVPMCEVKQGKVPSAPSESNEAVLSLVSSAQSDDGQYEYATFPSKYPDNV